MVKLDKFVLDNNVRGAMYKIYVEEMQNIHFG